jgi:hypothetical protein
MAENRNHLDDIHRASEAAGGGRIPWLDKSAAVVTGILALSALVLQGLSQFASFEVRLTVLGVAAMVCVGTLLYPAFKRRFPNANLEEQPLSAFAIPPVLSVALCLIIGFIAIDAFLVYRRRSQPIDVLTCRVKTAVVEDVGVCHDCEKFGYQRWYTSRVDLISRASHHPKTEDLYSLQCGFIDLRIAKRDHVDTVTIDDIEVEVLLNPARRMHRVCHNFSLAA